MSNETDATGNETPADDGTIILPDRVEIRTVGGIADRIRNATGPITLRADKVTLVTSPGAQLFVAAVRDGIELTVTHQSNAFEDCWAMLGVEPVTLTPVRSPSEGAAA